MLFRSSERSTGLGLLLFLVPCLTLICTGGGRYSIDAWLARRARPSAAARS